MKEHPSNRSLAFIIGALLTVLATGNTFAGFSGTDVFLPSVGAKPGVAPAVWYTTVWVHNPNPTSANVTFYLLERQANLAPRSFTDTIPPGDTRRYDNAVKSMFDVEAFGAIRVASNVKILAGARIYSQSGSLDDSVGQYFAGLPAAFAIGSGQSTELTSIWQTQPSTDSTFRTNFGFVETTGTGTCQLKVTVKDTTGAPLGTKTYTLRQWEQMQKSLSSEFPSLSTDNARLTVEVTSGSGKALAFGSSVANGSQDPATIEMQFRDELLGGGSGGLSVVTHDGTLTGDGTAASPIGIATNGVTSDKIADATIRTADLGDTSVTAAKLASGAVSTSQLADQSVTLAKLKTMAAPTGTRVLMTDSSSLFWSTGAPLNPPVSGDSNNTALPLLRITATSSTGSNAAIKGVTQSSSGTAGEFSATSTTGGAVALYGESASAAGSAVVAIATGTGDTHGVTAQTTSPTSIAVFGKSINASGATFGVLGEAASAGGAGVKGRFTKTSGRGTGVLGETASDDGYGVRGISTDTTANGAGVIGESASPTAPGVLGMYTRTSGAGVGVKGVCDAPACAGGYFQGRIGVYASSLKGTGTSEPALLAEALATSGGIAIFAKNRSPDATVVGANTGSGDLLKLFAGSTGGELRFQVQNDGDVRADGTFASPAADFAELLPAGEGLEPGDVLAVDLEGRLTRSTSAYQSSVVGVYSTKPAFLGGSPAGPAAEDLVPLAVVGVVPVKVSATNGPILPGDILVASPVPGHAMKAKPLEVQGVKIFPAGTLLGKALERFDGPGTGTITGLVNTK